MSDQYKAATEKLVSCVLTLSKVNNDEWMAYIVDEINNWAKAVGKTERVKLFRGSLRIVSDVEKGGAS